MRILGINAFYHDSAAALFDNGRLVSAIEEERFTRIKHDNQFPFKAIEFCLKSNNLTINDIDYVAYYEKPLLKFERILETFLDTWPYALGPFLKSIPDWLGNKIKVEYLIRKKVCYKGKIFFLPHHYSHAAAAYFSSPFRSAAIMTIDGVGEYQTTGLWIGKNNSLKPLKLINFPHSVGLLYSTFTAFLGFRVNEDEYKLMGLSAYGSPRYEHKVRKVIDIKSDGSFALNMKYFSYQESFRMWNRNFERLFGKPRKSRDPFEKRHRDIAASIQKVTEHIYLSALNHLYSLVPQTNLCISGGVGLNALANGMIYANTPFRNVHVLGSAGDSGAAIGAALYVHHGILGNKKRNPITSLCIGSSYTNAHIEEVLRSNKLTYKKFSNENELIDTVAKLLVKNKIVGWFQDKCEYGPRALGARSILSKASPRSMKERVNIIKRREQYRPFAASGLQEYIHEIFDVQEKAHASPFMNFCFRVKKERRQEIAAIVHKDNTCRIQTVSPVNGRYYKLIKKFYELTGTPCILNTSYNLKGEPIVETPAQAIDDFQKTKMDYLIIGDYLVSKH